MYDPAAAAWTDLTDRLTGAKIPGRCGHGFLSAGGLLFVFYGSGNVGAFQSTSYCLITRLG